MLPAVESCLHVDCLAAGRAATGQWAPVDQLSKQIHNLELVLREMNGVEVTIEHVKGHSGDGWNEMADGIAKLAAQGRPRLTSLGSALNLRLTALGRSTSGTEPYIGRRTLASRINWRSSN